MVFLGGGAISWGGGLFLIPLDAPPQVALASARLISKDRDSYHCREDTGYESRPVVEIQVTNRPFFAVSVDFPHTLSKSDN